MRPGSAFVPRLIPGEDCDAIDVLVITRALTAEKKDILGIQACFGGKAYDVTWLSETAAVRAASSGLDVGDRHFDVHLLGRRSLDVCFRCMRIPRRLPNNMALYTHLRYNIYY